MARASLYGPLAMSLFRRATQLVCFAALTAGLGACGSAVNPYDSDGGDRDGSVSADSRPTPDASTADGPLVPPPRGCIAPDGTPVPAGTSVLAPDGCNQCVCQPSGAFACTEIACVDAGVPDRPLGGECIFNEDCGPELLCEATPGCGVPGICVSRRDCTDDIAQYCMCDGTTRTGGSNCAPGVYQHRGPCGSPTVDAGTVDAAVDAGEPGLRDCAIQHVLCNAVAPTCPRGMTNSVRGRCWGECVPIRACEPLACDPRRSVQQCPQHTYCSPRTNSCVEDAPGGG